jgi:hypothetical protein
MVADLFSEHPPPERSQYGVTPRATAARADPVTSHEAADRVNAAGTARTNAIAVARLVRLAPGSTACELLAQYEKVRRNGTRWPHLDRHEISRRLPDAERAGWVTRGEPRECRVAGTRQLTWNPAEPPDGADDDRAEDGPMEP